MVVLLHYTVKVLMLLMTLDTSNALILIMQLVNILIQDAFMTPRKVDIMKSRDITNLHMVLNVNGMVIHGATIIAQP